jgi:Secretion system C-terminal sorting domain
MKKVFLLTLVLAVTLLAFNFQSQPPVLNNVAVQFITTNGYGNNVYVDNFMLGTQFQYDVAVSSINIPKDSNYSVNGASSFKILPKVVVSNVGTASASSFNVVLTAGAYTSTKPAPTINSGNSAEISFDSLTITPNTALNIKAYSTWAQDMSKANDTLKQYTLYLPGAQRKVVFEAFTSSTCAPCASQNPYLDAFMLSRMDTLVPVKTHVWWPSPGNDPMYLINSTQIQPRVSTYYAVSAVPTLIIDGVIVQVSGYSTLSNLLNPYTLRLAKGAPLSVNVVDTKIGDSIKTNISVNVISPLPAGTYKLHVNSLSTKISYPTAPGTNGETVFKDVFRYAYPDINGTSIPTTPGTYNYEFRYKLTPMAGASDTLYYTSAFVQNDANKEILNAGKAMHYVPPTDIYTNSYASVDSKPMPLPSFVNSNNITITGAQTYSVNAGFNYEVFEGGFPPAGWTVVNPNAGSLTWEAYSGANGPLFGGTKCTRVNCYSYSTTGQVDYLKSPIYNNVDLTDSLKFNWAHAVYTGYTERLQVQVSTNGGSTYPYTIFDRSGAALATAPASSSDFVPADASQWGRFSIAMGSILTSIRQIGTETPTVYALNQNYPNPFNPVTNISYNLPKSSKVSLKVYDIKGQLISTLFEGNQNTGIYLTQFDGSKLASGVYFYKLEAGDYKEVRKMTLIK